MEKISNSSLWIEKYRPQTINDLILPSDLKSLFESFVSDGEIQNILLYGGAGKGKTSTAYALTTQLGCDVLYLNGSLDNKIDDVRYTVQQFATTGSFKSGKKVVIIDECDRMVSAQEALKSLMEQTESNCRFILTTNNITKH